MTTTTDPPGMHLCDPAIAGGYYLPIDKPCPVPITMEPPPSTSTPPPTDCWHAVPVRNDCGPNPSTTTTTIINYTPPPPTTPTTPPEPSTEPTTTTVPIDLTGPVHVVMGPPKTHPVTTQPAQLPPTGAGSSTPPLALTGVSVLLMGIVLVKWAKRPRVRNLDV